MEISYQKPPWGGKKGPWIKGGVALVVILLAVGVGYMLSRVIPSTGFFGSKEKELEALSWTVSGAPQIGQEAPDLIFKSYEGKNFKLSDLRGKVVLLNFWATWCPPCREEMPSMETLYQDFRDKGFVIVAVNVDQGGKSSIARFKRETPFTFPVALDPETDAVKTYKITSIPANFVIDRQGKIVNKGVGAVDWNSLKARGFLTKLLS